MNNIDAQYRKKLLRAELAQVRAAWAASEEHASMLAAQLNVLTAELGAGVVAIYLPFGNEPNISGFIEQASAEGIRLIAPVSQPNGSMHWVEYTGKTAPGIFGFEEPVGEPALLSSAHLMFMPALAADARGNRLGKGKGYYDVALAADRNFKVAAVVFEQEVLPEVPVEPHDQPVDYVVTPQRIIQAVKI